MWVCREADLYANGPAVGGETVTDEIQRATAEDRDRWQRFVDDHPAATVFHTWGWQRAVGSALGYDPAHRIVTEGGAGEPVGLVPGFVIPGLAGTTVLNPVCEYGFPLFSAGVDSVAVLRQLADDVGRFGARILTDAGWTGVRGYNVAGYGAVRTGEVVRLDTDRAFDAVRERSFRGVARRRVRSAVEGGVTVRPASVTEYYPLYLARMRRLDGPRLPEELFVALADTLGETLSVFVAEYDGAPIGGILMLDFDATRVIWSNASRHSARESHPDYRLYAAAIEDACATGIDVVDLGRSRAGTDAHTLKTQFGGTTSPLARFVTPPHRANRAAQQGDSRVRAVAERLSPLGTNPVVGPRRTRYIHE